MGTIYKYIEVCDEDIMHLKNALQELYEKLDIERKNKEPPKEHLEIYTIQSIISRWDESVKLSELINKWFQKGVESVLRNNESGCVCKFHENDNIIELCMAHKQYYEEKFKQEKKGE